MLVQDKVLELYIFGQYEDYKDVFAVINITFNEKYLLKKMTEKLKELTQEQQEEILNELNKKEWKMAEKGAYVELRTMNGFKFKKMAPTGQVQEDILLDLISNDLVGYERDVDGRVTLKFYDGTARQSISIDDDNIEFLAIDSKFGGNIVKSDNKSVWNV